MRTAISRGTGGLLLLAALAWPAAAQPGTASGVVIESRTGRPASAPLVPGRRIAAPQGGWSEVLLSDGSSIVLERGAVLTVQSLGRDPATGRILLVATATGGTLRLTAAEDAELRIATPGGEVRIAGASAVVEARPDGRVTLVSGRGVSVLRPGGREDRIRRPGFALTFDDGGPQRRSRSDIAAAVDPFAPVERRETRPPQTVANPTVELASAPDQRPDPLAEDRRRTLQQRNGVAVPGGRGAGESFALAAAALGQAGVGGSTLAAPRANAGTSVLGGANSQVDPNSQEPDANIAGIASISSFGTGRVRRFAPGASGATVTSSNIVVAAPGRDDSGLVTLGGRQPVGAGFAPLATARLSQTQGQAVYDASARIGVVDINAFAPVTEGNFGVGLNLVRLPRVSIADSATPTATLYRNTTDASRPSYSVSGVGFQSFQSNQVLVQFGGPGDGRVINGPALSETQFAAAIDAVRNEITANPTTAIVVLARQGIVQWQLFGVGDGPRTINGAVLSDAEFNAAGRALLAAAQPNPGDITLRTDARQLVYTGSALFEVGLQDRSVGTQVRRDATDPPVILATTPTNGAVSRLFGEIGLISYVGGTELPSLTVIGGAPGVGGRTGGTITIDGLAEDLNTPGNVRDPETVRPLVVIIDKITRSSDAVFRERGIEQGERYFVIGGTPVAPVSSGLPGTSNGQVTRFAVSDGLNPLGGFTEGATIEAQFYRADQPVAFNRFNGFRPDETYVIRPGAIDARPVGRGDTNLLVVSGDARTPTAAMRADFELANGLSSAGISVGGVGRFGNSLVLSGSTVGTARLAATEASRSISSSFGSLGTDATGTEEHIFPSASDTAQAGYMAIGTQDVRRGSPGSDGGQPGVIEAVGSTDATPFTFTRLATNVSVGAAAQPPAILPQGGAVTLLGFAAGIVESVRPNGILLHGVSTEGLGGVTIERGTGSNEYAAVITMVPRTAGELAVNPFAAAAPNGVRGTQALGFGARDANDQPTTAWAGADTFAAIRPSANRSTDRGAAMASVNADLLRGIEGGASAMPSSTEHLAWGLFLGDLVNDAAGQRRDHVNLGFWVAGRPVDIGTLSTLRGTASYAGGMIGNVARDGAIRTATGTFSQSWDFGARRGTLSAAFDGRDYAARAAMPSGSAVFSGSGLSGDRRLVVQGAFFDARSSIPAGLFPAAVGGAFGIAGSGYAANGVFVGGVR